MSAAGKMTEEHKAAIAEGRREAAAVRRYLAALEEGRRSPRRGRTPESITAKLVETESALSDAAPLRRVELIQERMDLDAELEALTGSQPDLSELEDGFCAVAAAYSERKSISYKAWREFGVEASVLKRAGLRS